jgi:hypothetical protein
MAKFVEEDGIVWAKVRVSIDVEVMADNVEDAMYHAMLSLDFDENLPWSAEVLDQ